MQDLDDQIANRQTISEVMHGLQTTKPYRKTHYIEIQYKLGASMNKISQDLNRSQSTISREIARNTGKRGYRHKQANELAVNRHKEKDKAYKLTPTVKVLIEGYLQQAP